ncbi:MAG: hypothetical protein KTR30_28795 [Saprospiraceae bacterium]|nr:hypothetical protein [Saprospiraceae bacterium]
MELLRTNWLKARQLWGNWWGDDSRLPANDPLQQYIRVAGLIGIYIVLDRLLMRATHLSFDRYEAPFIYGEFIKQLFRSWYGLALVGAVSFSLVFWGRLLVKWQQLDFGTSLRWLILAATGALAWSYSTYDFNLFFNQAHLLDRSLLLLFLILVFWRPIFVFPFLTLLLPVVWQFTLMIGFSWTMTYLLLRTLVLFVAGFALYLVNKRFPVQEFILVLGCLYASHYWQPGWGKLSWEWIRSNEIFLILPASYSNNWLAHLSAEQMLSFMRFFVPLNGLMKLFVMFVEFGAFLFFLHRKLPLIFLAGWVAMHLGILAFTGIDLWMWIIVDTTLLILLLKKNGLGQFLRLSPAQIVLSMLLVIAGRFWCKPVEISWYDMPFSYAYEAQAVTVDGEEVDLPLSFFAPYDYQFTMTGLSYLAPQPVLFISDVKGEAALAKELLAIRSKEEFLDMEAKHGLGGQDEEVTADFDAIVKRFLQNWNKRLDKETLFSKISAPNIVMHYPKKLPTVGAKALKEVRFYQVTALFYKESYEEIRRIPIRTVRVDQ